MSELPISPFGRILKNAGAIRVSDSAKIELRDIIENIAIDIAEEALTLSKHAGRKTIKASDIELSFENYYN